MDRVIHPPRRDDPRNVVLRSRPDGRFLGPGEFCRLLVSRRKLSRIELSRIEGASARVRGLLDPATGETYWVEEDELLYHGCA